MPTSELLVYFAAEKQGAVLLVGIGAAAADLAPMSRAVGEGR